MRNHFKTTIVHRNTRGTQDYQTTPLHFPARAATGGYRMRVALWVRGCFTCTVGVLWKTLWRGWTGYVKPEPWTAATPVAVSENVQYLYCAVVQKTDYRPHFTCGGVLYFLNHYKHTARFLNTVRQTANCVRALTKNQQTRPACAPSQYSQMELIFWITLLNGLSKIDSGYSVCEGC